MRNGPQQDPYKNRVFEGFFSRAVVIKRVLIKTVFSRKEKCLPSGEGDGGRGVTNVSYKREDAIREKGGHKSSMIIQNIPMNPATCLNMYL